VDSGPPSLLARAARELADGPRHTLELARGVLGLSGNPRVAARAVFTLLGADERFQVDEAGRWRMAEGVASPGLPLTRLSYAVVDVETTGGSWRKGHRVTEVAIVGVEEGRVTDRYETLVNPERPIPPWVQGLTGITNEMVAAAPPFHGVAPEVERRLEGRIFVAHNVSFDWGFVRNELLECTGDPPELDRLCTVRLGRLILPELRSHALGSLSAHLGIGITARHRAGGDALATARVLLHLLMEAESRGLSDRTSLETALARRGGRRRRTGER
jgi:DNA polymerase III subunit epsilon